MPEPSSAAYEETLDRVGRYLAECFGAAGHNATIRFCERHPVTVADIWTLYCAHRENGNTAAPRPSSLRGGPIRGR